MKVIDKVLNGTVYHAEHENCNDDKDNRWVVRKQHRVLPGWLLFALGLLVGAVVVAPLGPAFCFFRGCWGLLGSGCPSPAVESIYIFRILRKSWRSKYVFHVWHESLKKETFVTLRTTAVVKWMKVRLVSRKPCNDDKDNRWVENNTGYYPADSLPWDSWDL